MVKVTWITPFAPDRSGGGGQSRQAHLLLALSQRAEIDLICPGRVADPAVRAAVARLVELQPVTSQWREDHPWWRRAADLGASVALRQPLEVRAFRPVRRALRRALGPSGHGAGAFGADVVLVEYAGLIPLLPGWVSGRRDRRRSRWVLTLHNLPSRMAAHSGALVAPGRRRWLLRRDAQVAARYERRAAAAFDAVVTCTTQDAAALLRQPARTRPRRDSKNGGGAHVLVVPNGTDVERFQPTPLPGGFRIVFTGALYTAPNIDGAQWFCRRVLPRIRLLVPSAEVALVGARPTGDVRVLGDQAGVTVYPDVASVVPYLEAARVAVVPIRIGSGSRVKALEALAAGRPVVGTSIGLEGLDLRSGEHALVADDAEAFADAVARLLRDDGLANALATAGRAEVERRFAWPAIAATFTDSVVALAEARRDLSVG